MPRPRHGGAGRCEAHQAAPRQQGGAQRKAIVPAVLKAARQVDIEELKREVEVLRRLNHPNIVALLDVQTTQDFLVTTRAARGTQPERSASHRMSSWSTYRATRFIHRCERKMRPVLFSEVRAPDPRDGRGAGAADGQVRSSGESACLQSIACLLIGNGGRSCSAAWPTVTRTVRRCPAATCG
jgi:hypothetical protein